jgi:hypothetical protein
LVIQHSNLEKQLKYLNILKANCEKQESNWADYALMYDRILVFQQKKQLYGSQVRFSRSSNKWELFPIEDEHNVNKRRNSIGLNSMSDYLKEWNIDYNVPQND